MLLGIDERTAAVWADGTWRVEGPGTVTVVDAEGEWRHGAGEPIDGLPAPRAAGVPRRAGAETDGTADPGVVVSADDHQADR